MNDRVFKVLRNRLMAGAKHDRPARLHGIVEADETYCSVSQKAAAT